MELREFKAALKPYTAVLGFDFGTKRLGVAVSDLMGLVATADKTIFRAGLNEDIAAIRKLVETAAAVRKFAQQVAAEIPLPYAFWDERLSSKAMENFLIKEADMSRAKRKQILDSSSAAYILQGALDALRYL